MLHWGGRGGMAKTCCFNPLGWYWSLPLSACFVKLKLWTWTKWNIEHFFGHQKTWGSCSEWIANTTWLAFGYKLIFTGVRILSQFFCAFKPFQSIYLYSAQRCVDEAMKFYLLVLLALGFGICFGSLLPPMGNQLWARLNGRDDRGKQNEKPKASLQNRPEAENGENSTSPSLPGLRFNLSQSPSPKVGGEGLSEKQAHPTQLRVDGDFLKRDSRKPFMALPPEADCDPRVHVFAINAEGSEGQLGRDHIKQEFKKAGLKDYHFWPLASDCCKSAESNESIPDHLRQALTHRKIYETMLSSKWACATIFEDNVSLADDFASRVGAITVTESIPPFDVILWGWCPPPDMPEGGDKSDKPLLRYGQPGPCLFAYTVSLQGALLLSKANTPIRFKADEALESKTWEANLRPRVDKSPKKLGGSYWHVLPMIAFKGGQRPSVS